MLIRWKSKDKTNSSSGSKKKRKGREGGKVFFMYTVSLLATNICSHTQHPDALQILRYLNVIGLEKDHLQQHTLSYSISS